MIKIIPKDSKNIHILVATGNECPSLASIALKNRLFVSGWEMSHTLREIRHNPHKATIAVLFEDNVPMSISLQERCSRVQSFTRKAKRRQGYGSMTFDCVIKYKENEKFYHEYGISGSLDFFHHAKNANKEFSEHYIQE